MEQTLPPVHLFFREEGPSPQALLEEAFRLYLKARLEDGPV